MTVLRVPVQAVLLVDTDRWREIDLDNLDPDHDPTTATEDEIGWVARGLFPIEDRLPRWARDAITVTEEI